MELTEFLARKQTRSGESQKKKSRNVPFSRLLATGLGVGYLPFAPGTWGALEAVALTALVQLLPPATALSLHIVLVVFFLLAGFISAGRVARADRISDPTYVVIDEVIGQMLCFLFVPVTALSLLIGFGFFRILDITKPFPARHGEFLPGAWGIIVDDVIAGIYAGIVTLFLTRLIEMWF
ncbi:MAG TPA: phosphatidylglycerophosphatase A [Acidobacteriota bacterium]|nr:phosphatidylglycerophosphatase A [Acidobacteriota bacterium]